MPTKEPTGGLDAVVAANLRALRAGRRLRQVDVAKLASMNRASLASIESERRRVSLDDAARLCAALEVTLDELLRGADPADLAALGLDAE